jgi:hypothetical protein
VALPLFAAVFAWERRTVFWRYALIVLALYAALLPAALGAWTTALVPHVLAALLAWLFTRVLPWPRPRPAAPEPADTLRARAAG